jgi:hypothetical protein
VADAFNVISGNTTGVFVNGSNNQIQNSLIGTDNTGTLPVGNGVGIHVRGANNTVGSTVPGAGNLISANGTGVYLEGNGASGNLIQQNYIGTNWDGTAARGNVTGMRLQNAGPNIVGGTTVASRNLISGNTGVGILIDGSSTGNLVQGNYIGTKFDGTSGLGNGTGVRITASSNTIGGAAGAGNIIAFNNNNGVHVDTGTGNAIRQNSIHSNGGYGIRLVNNGNNNQAAPKMLKVTSTGGITKMVLQLVSTANTSFVIDVFRNSVCDGSGFGEGETHVRTLNLTTNAGGVANISVTFPASIPPGHVLTATATSPNNNTSEFSKCAPVLSVTAAAVSPVTPPLPSIGLDGDSASDALRNRHMTTLTTNGVLFSTQASYVVRPSELNRRMGASINVVAARPLHRLRAPMDANWADPFATAIELDWPVLD